MSAAIVHGTKDIENRPLNLPKRMRGVPTIVAVHAGKKWDDEYDAAVRRVDGHCEAFPALPYFEHLKAEGIVGLMLLSGRVYTSLAEVQLSRTLRNPMRSAKWWGGPYGYEVAAAIAFPSPIPCRGMQGWWPVPNDIAAAITHGPAHAELLERAPADLRDRYLFGRAA